MSTYTVTALEPYTYVIEDYAYVVYSWSIALHLFLTTRLYNIVMTCMVLVGKQHLK